MTHPKLDKILQQNLIQFVDFVTYISNWIKRTVFELFKLIFDLRYIDKTSKTKMAIWLELHLFVFWQKLS